MSMQKIKVKGERSRSQRSEQILPQLGHFRKITPGLFHRWLQNEAQRLKLCRRGALLFFKKFTQIEKLKNFFTWIERFQTVNPVWIHRWLQNDAQNLKWQRRVVLLFFKVICQISRSQYPVMKLNSFENCIIDEIFGCPIFKWVAVTWLNSLIPRRYGRNFKSIILNLIIWYSSWDTCCVIAHWWMPLN